MKPTRRFAPLVFGTLFLSGCGGVSSLDNAVVVPDPSVNIAANPAAAALGTIAAPAPAAGAPADAAPAAGTAAAPAAAPTTSDGFGTLKGKVVLEGAKPTLKFLVNKGDAGVKDAAVCATVDVPNEALLTGADGKGVKYALVYIPKPTAVSPEAVSAAQAAKVVFDQKNCVFVPHVIGFMKGQTIDIISSDPVGHNVNAKMRANGASNNLLGPGQKTTFTPKAAEGRPSEVTCDIHPWMKAYWLILDNPYFAITNENGEFEIKNAPAGTQKIVVWQEAVQFVTPPSGTDVVVPKDGVTENLEFKVDSAKVKIN
jgi:plastocyanin